MKYIIFLLSFGVSIITKAQSNSFGVFSGNVGANIGINYSDVENTIKIFPNPNKGIFSIKSETKVQSIYVFNMLGDVIYSSKNNFIETTIDLTNQPKGVYFYQLKTETGDIKPGKIIID